MKNEFTAIVEHDDGWFVAHSPELPGANGQGRTREDAIDSLAKVIELILLDRREDALRTHPDDSVRSTITVG